MRISIKEASEMLGIPAQAVRVLMEKGKLPIGEVMEGRKRKTYYIFKERTEAYLCTRKSE